MLIVLFLVAKIVLQNMRFINVNQFYIFCCVVIVTTLMKNE